MDIDIQTYNVPRLEDQITFEGGENCKHEVVFYTNNNNTFPVGIRESYGVSSNTGLRDLVTEAAETYDFRGILPGNEIRTEAGLIQIDRGDFGLELVGGEELTENFFQISSADHPGRYIGWVLFTKVPREENFKPYMVNQERVGAEDFPIIDPRSGEYV